MSKPGNEVKARLFAMYLNQDVYMRDDFTPRDVQKLTGHYITESATYFIEHGYLLLRSIESLTDEEIITVTTIIWGNQVSDTTKIIARDGVINMFNSGWNVDGNRMLQIFDYLRSIGVALPFTFLDENQQPQTSSVTEQVEMGWIKLVTK